MRTAVTARLFISSLGIDGCYQTLQDACGIWTVWHADRVACGPCGMRTVWHADRVACEPCGMLTVWHADRHADRVACGPRLRPLCLFRYLVLTGPIRHFTMRVACGPCGMWTVWHADRVACGPCSMRTV